MTGILDPPPAEKFGVLHQLSYQATQKEQKGQRVSVETRSPGKSRTSCVETRAALSPHIQAGDNVSCVFVADHHHRDAGTSEAVAAMGRAPTSEGLAGPRLPPSKTARGELGSPLGRKQHTFYPQYIQKSALVIEDIREACIELRQRGYVCDSITHNELMASTGQEYTGNLIKGDYKLLWIATPSDWYVRTPENEQILTGSGYNHGYAQQQI